MENVDPKFDHSLPVEIEHIAQLLRSQLHGQKQKKTRSKRQISPKKKKTF